jgi:predicted negative regulator of RcsB-dependent stress response
MATYDLEEQEQIDEIKVWWKQYGNLLINILTGAALIVIAWQGWNWYQRNQSAQAAAVFNVLHNAAQDKDTQRLKAASGELVEKFGGTSYASLGALTTAKAMIDAGDAKTGKLQLQWVVDHGKDELRDVARLRLAAVLLDEKAYDQALQQLDGPVSPSFAVRFADTRGDVLTAQGKKAEALTAYQAALAKFDDKGAQGREAAGGWEGQSHAVYRQLVQQKLDALGGAK